MTHPDQLAESVEDALRPAVEDADLYLEEVCVGRAGSRSVVRVTVDLRDGPGGVGSDALTRVSRSISSILDEADVVQGAYTLEVSTPGAERKLTEPRHFRRAQGRLLDLATGGENLVGRLTAVEGDTLVLDVDGEPHRVALAGVERARVRVELSRPDGQT